MIFILRSTHTRPHIGVDDLLAQHVAHLFIRDSVSLFAEKLEQSVENESDHFEVNINLSCTHFSKSASDWITLTPFCVRRGVVAFRGLKLQFALCNVF